MARLGGPTRLVIGGWVLALVASALIVVVKLGEPGASEGVVFAMIAVAMGAWVWIRGSGAAMITSLVLGALWTVMFGGYVITGVAADLEPVSLVFITDIIAAIGGVLLVAGAATSLARRRSRRSASGATA